VTTGRPLIIVDNSAADDGFVNFLCADDTLFESEIVLTPSVTLQPGFSTDSDGSAGVHVTINDGLRRIRAVLMQGPSSAQVRVSIQRINGFSPGFVFNELTADFTLSRTTNGDAVLKVGGLTDVVPADQLPPTPVATNRVEFGNYRTTATATTQWDRIGLPAKPAFAAQVEPPINPDGSSTFNAKRGVVPLTFRARSSAKS
jgi:hypothetical protein